MNDAQRVRLGQGIGHLAHQLDGAHRRHWSVGLQGFQQAATVDVFENQIEVAVLLAGIVDGHHVGMMKLADRARLVEQHGVELGVGIGKMQGLDRHLALQLRVPGEINHALAAPSQLATNLETPDHARHRFSRFPPVSSRR